MYLKRLKIWNFRKFGGEVGGDPGLILEFHHKFNLLIGENDAGKSTIIDAIHLTIGVLGGENYKVSNGDFHVNNNGDLVNEIKIECTFADLNEREQGVFLDWLTFNENNEYEFIISFEAKKINNNLVGERIDKYVKAGPENFQTRLEGYASELLKATYLKPLRDAKRELKPGIRSRLAQILKSYSAFKVTDNETHELEKIATNTNEEIKKYFDTPIEEKTITGEISNYLNEFFNIPMGASEKYNPRFEVTPARLNDILRKLSLELDDNVSGLGSSNLLFIAAELLLLNDGDSIGPNLTLIEEIEAHLHPQAQLRLIKYLQKTIEENGEKINGQFILSTHSTTLAASTALEHVILIHNKNAYPMGQESTSLAQEDYEFLERFLDATKANLFFARGVIFVEGDAENLLLPIVSDIIDRPLHKYGVSIVNIGNTAFKRYSKIFSRSEEWLSKGYPSLSLPVSVVTDVDIRPIEYYHDKKLSLDQLVIESEHIEDILQLCEGLENGDLQDYIGETISSFNKFKTIINSLGANVHESKKDEITRLLTKKIDKEFINRKKEVKKSRIESEFNNLDSNVKVFVAQNWTLEYEIALSSLGDTLAQVIHEVRYKHPNRKSVMTKLEANLKMLEQEDERENAAYEIYKPLNDKIVSKAIIAQKLAHELKIKKNELKELIKNDPYLDYLAQAIYHVTEMPYQEENND